MHRPTFLRVLNFTGPLSMLGGAAWGAAIGGDHHATAGAWIGAGLGVVAAAWTAWDMARAARKVREAGR